MAANLKEKVISSLFWKLFEKGGSAVASLIIQIVLARLLMPSDFGLLAIMLVFINLSGVFIDSGLSTALIQSPEASDEDFSTVFWLSLGLATVLYLIVFLIAPAVAQLYAEPSIVVPLRVLALTFFIGCFNGIQGTKVARELAFRLTFKATLIAVVVSGAVGIGIAFAGGGIWALVAQSLTASVVSFLVLRTQIKWRPHLAFNLKRAAELFSFGWKMMVSSLINTGYQSLQNLIVGKQFNTSELGFVTQGEKYPNAISKTLDGAIQSVMMPAVAHIQDDLDYVLRVLRRALRTSTFCIFPVMGLMALVAEPLVQVLLGEKWLPCVPFLQMYCFIYAQPAIQSSNIQTMLGIGRSDIFLKLELLNKCASVIALLIAAFVLQNVYAVVVGAMLCSILTTFLDVLPTRRVLDYSFKELAKDTVPAAALTVASMLIAFPIAFASLPVWVILLLQILAMPAVYLALSRLFHLESFEYLLGTLKSTLAKRENRS